MKKDIKKLSLDPNKKLPKRGIINADELDNGIVESTENTEQKLKDKKRNLPQLFKKGAEWTGNKNGRPKGSRSFNKMVDEALKSLEEKYRKKGISIPDFELEIFEKLLNDVRAGKDKARDTFMKFRFAAPKQEIQLSGKLGIQLSEQEEAEIDEMADKLNNFLEKP